MLAWENWGFFKDASVRIAIFDRDVPSSSKSLDYLLRCPAPPPSASERPFVIHGRYPRLTRVRYVLPRHEAANWVGPGRGWPTYRSGLDSGYAVFCRHSFQPGSTRTSHA